MIRLHPMVLVFGLLAGCSEKAKAVEQKLAAEAEMALGARGPYAQPSSPCDVVDLRPLGSDVGRATSTATQTEGDGHQITGCIVDLSASDGDNRFKLFVSVDSDPDGRFAVFDQAWSDARTTGHTVEPVELGSRAIYAAHVSGDGLHIETVLGVLDQNLYLEARFTGDGSQAWDSADMRDRLVGAAGSAMNSLAR